MPDEQAVSVKGIARHIARHQEVDDVHGRRVGHVREYDLAAGWLLMEREVTGRGHVCPARRHHPRRRAEDPLVAIQACARLEGVLFAEDIA